MLSALSFLTVAGKGQAPDAKTFRWFPLVGAAIGGLVALSFRGAEAWWALPVAAAIAVAVDLGVTGLLHVDGLADSVDGLLPHLPRERRLEVMRQPDVGGFALGVVPAVLLLRWASLATGSVDPWSIVGVWCASRTVVAVVPALVPYARAEGLASPFIEGAQLAIALALVPAAGLLIWAQGATGAVALLALIATAVGMVAIAKARLGGFTGDVLGAAILLSETVALLVLAARP